MQIKEIMARQVITIRPEETVAAAARRMAQASIGCLVVANAGAVKGIITDRDLAVRCIAEGDDPRQCTVAQHMTTALVTASPTMDVLDAAHLLVQRRVKRLPVVEEERLVGLVSLSDIAQALDQPLHDLLLGMGAARRAA